MLCLPLFCILDSFEANDAITAIPLPELTNDRALAHKLQLELDQNVLLLASFLLPFVLYNNFPFTKWHMREVWKWKNKTIDWIFLLHESFVELRGLITYFANHEECDRVSAGFLLKRMEEKWVHALDLHLVSQLFADHNADSKTIIQLHQRFAGYLRELRFLGDFPAWKWPPLFKPNELTALLNISKGQEIGDAVKMVQSWQFLYPDGSREDCEAWLLVQFPIRHL